MEDWKGITEETLKQLCYDKGMSDSLIAEKYGVTKAQVRYKRNKFGISSKNMTYDRFVLRNREVFEQLNKDSKERLLKAENIDGIAKALTHYAFRNGPVEDMHADGKLSQSDMKILNKYMVNRLAGILVAIFEERWVLLELLYANFQQYGTDWDKAEPDMRDLNLIWQQRLQEI